MNRQTDRKKTKTHVDAEKHWQGETEGESDMDKQTKHRDRKKEQI